MFHILLTGFLAIAAISDPICPKPIRYTSKQSIRIVEPSDICRNPNKNTFFVVSDRGFLYETDSVFKPFRQSTTTGFDYEGVFADNLFVYAIEERTRKINQFDILTLEKVRSVEVKYSGGRNAGYEGFVWNPTRKRFILITEKSPIILFELDSLLQVQNEIFLKDKITNKAPSIDLNAPQSWSFKRAWSKAWAYKGPSDVSSITWFKDKIYLLSDEDSEIIQLNASSFALENRWSLGVLNPEGFFFKEDGSVVVLSDNMQTAYQFPSILNSEGSK